jgi:hypothetical protein
MNCNFGTEKLTFYHKNERNTYFTNIYHKPTEKEIIKKSFKQINNCW